MTCQEEMKEVKIGFEQNKTDRETVTMSIT